jgi:hypothetical protein
MLQEKLSGLAHALGKLARFSGSYLGMASEVRVSLLHAM